MLLCVTQVSGIARENNGVASPPQCKESCCLRNAQICNKIFTLKSSPEIANATAPFYLEKGASLYLRGNFLKVKECDLANYPGDSAITPINQPNTHSSFLARLLSLQCALDVFGAQF